MGIGVSTMIANLTAQPAQPVLPRRHVEVAEPLAPETISTRLSFLSLALSTVAVLLWLAFWAAGTPGAVWLVLLPVGVLLNGLGLMLALVADDKAKATRWHEVRTLARVATTLALVPVVGSVVLVALSLLGS